MADGASHALERTLTFENESAGEVRSKPVKAVARELDDEVGSRVERGIPWKFDASAPTIM
jgi:hypothetical protein